MSIPTLTGIAIKAVDNTTDSLTNINHSHHEKHEGDDFFLLYSVASLGALTTPDDTMTLTFTTPNTTKWGHFTFRVTGTAGWRIRLIEAPTGGATSPTGALTIFNSNRNSDNKSTFKDISGVVNQISYDALLATGGTTLWDEYIAGASGPQTAGDQGGHDEEIMLMQNTTYQLSMFGTDTNPGTLKLGWYEHTNK